MPKEVVSEHRYAFTNPLELKVADQTMWQVKLVINGLSGSCWIQDGFEDFARFYNLQQRSLLLFEYEKSGFYFDVKIFAENGSEIDYPMRIENSDDEMEDEYYLNKPNFDSEDDEYVMNLDGIPVKSSRAAKSPNFRSQTRRKSTKTSAQANTTSNKERRRRQLGLEFKTFVGRKIDSCRPFFMVTMSRTNLYPLYALRVPAGFAREHFPNTGGSVVLRGKDGTVWPAKYYHKVFGGKVKARIFKAWKPFAICNGLEEGDVCVFELIDHSPAEMTLEIEILPQGKGLKELLRI